MTTVCSFRDAACTRTEIAGGKGASLARLAQAGFRVPPGIVVTPEAYRAFAHDVPGDLTFAYDDPHALHAQCQEIRRRLLKRPLPEGVAELVVARLPALPVAVRSSSTLEDLAGAAFAGQHDTFLDVQDEAGVLDAIRRCFASLWEDRAVRYRHERGFDQDDAVMAVVIQSMVPADVAGVAFCLHPVTGDTDQIVVNAAPGLGERVVSGDGDIDQLVIDKKTGAVVEAVRQAEADVPVDDLRSLCLAVESYTAFPQDIEWAVADGTLYLLQSRPVTHFPERWTRDESAERFPNPVTPLTWDFTVEGFHESLSHSLGMLGMPAMGGRWFDRFDGYIYGNATAVALFTSGQQARFDSLDRLRALVPTLRERYGWVQQLPVTWARDLDGYLLTLGELGAVDLASLSPSELWAHILRIDALGRHYFLPNIAISITQGLLHKILFQFVALVLGPDQASDVYDGLTCFCETKTNVVTRDLHGLYQEALRDPALVEKLRHDDLRALTLEDHPAFEERLERFLSQHGHREVDFDPYQPGWGARPWIVLANVRLMLQRDDVEDPRVRERTLRLRQQETEIRFLAQVPEDLRFFASEILRLARAYTALDDLEHYQTTRLHPPIRKAFLEAGRRLGLTPPDDVFFLSRKSLEAGLLQGGEVQAEAAAGKAAYEQQCATNPSWVHGEVGSDAVASEDALRGLPGSPGVAEGPVHRVLSVDDFPHFPAGAVLLARTTNPAWTPLFYSACAVVTESGGPLSHGAVTAREVGLPAVMAVRGVLGALEDGMRVRVNGTTGTVEVLAD